MGLALLAKFLGFDAPDRTEPVMSPGPPARRRDVVDLGGAPRWSVWCCCRQSSYPNGRSRRGPTTSLDLLTLPLSFLQYVVTSPDLIWSYVGGVPAGKGLLVVAGLRAAVGVAVPGLGAPRRVGAGGAARRVAAFGLLPMPLTGHATDWIYHDL